MPSFLAASAGLYPCSVTSFIASSLNCLLYLPMTSAPFSGYYAAGERARHSWGRPGHSGVTLGSVPTPASPTLKITTPLLTTTSPIPPPPAARDQHFRHSDFVIDSSLG